MSQDTDEDPPGQDRVNLRKRAIRAAVRARRAARATSSSAAERAALRDRLTDQLISFATEHGVRSLGCYVPTPTEPDTTPFISWATDEGIDVLLPVSQPDHSLKWARAIDSELQPGLHGLLEPTAERLPAAAAEKLDLLLVPASAVDLQGTRLGWGLGYYDRTLASLARTPPIYAIVFDDDVIDEIPRDAHDVPIAGVITPLAVRHFADSAGNSMKPR